MKMEVRMTDKRSSVSRWARKSWKWILLAALAGAVFFYVRLRPVKAALHTVQLGRVQREVMGTGTLEARVGATVSSKIAGRVASIAVDQNDRISKGQMLVVLDDAELQQQVAIAAATLEERKAGLDHAKADVVRAEAVLSQAGKDHERVESLVRNKVEPAAELDKARERLDVAQAELERAKVAVVEAKSRIVSAERTLEYHRARLGDTTIVSPFDGLVVARRHEPGEIVVPGTPILDIVATQEMWVSAWVDESAMSEVAPGQRTRAVFRSEPGTSCDGEVVRLARSVDRESREFIADVLVKKLPERWAVGQRAEVYILTAEKRDVVVIPTRMVVHRDGKPGAMVVERGRARWRELDVGLRGTGMVEVIKGLSPGQEIIATNAREGQRIAR